MKIPYKKTWQLFEREDYANYLFVAATWEAFTSTLPRKLGFTRGRFFGAEYINRACNLFGLKEPYDRANRSYFEMLFTKPDAWDKLHGFTELQAKKLFRLGKRIKRLEVRSLSNRRLLQIVGVFQKAQAFVHVPRGPMFLLETPNNLVTDYLLNYLKEKAKDFQATAFSPQEAFRILTTSLKESIRAKEKFELARIALQKSQTERKVLLKQHSRKYEWLEYGLQGRVLPLEHFQQTLRHIQRVGASRFIKKEQAVVFAIAKKQRQIFSKFRIHPAHRMVFRIVQDSFHARLLSKDAQFFGYYCMEGVFSEIGRRLGLSLEQVRFLSHHDFAPALLRGKDFSDVAAQRQKYSLLFCDRGKSVYFSGVRAKKIRAKMKFQQAVSEKAKGQQLQGQSAFGGRAKGRVKIINTVQELSKMHTGNILVSHMTNPGIVPAMKMAAAIVTDLGGITSHAAIVARELKKPCVIGTGSATKQLMDGDWVEVDANVGIVKKL